MDCRSWRSHIFALVVFFVLFAVFTWPLLPNIGKLYPSLQSIGGSNDPSFFIGYLDVVSKGLLGRNPVPTETMVFYPRGIDMLGAYDGPLMFLIAIPANILFGNPVLAYNLVLAASFLFTAMGMYFLLRYLVGPRFALCVFGGALFGFSPYMLIRGLAHLNLMMLGVVPLFVLFALKFAKRPSPKGVLLLFAMTGITALSSWYYALCGVLFLAAVFLAHWRTLWRAKVLAVLGGLSVGLALFLVAVPVLSSENRGSLPMSDEFAFNASAQLPNLFLPTPMSPFFGRYTNEIYEKFPTVIFPKAPNYYEMTSYLGVIGLLGIAGLILMRKIGRSDIPFWAIVGVIFLMLALGPYVFVFHHKILLPFYFLRRVYPFDLFRVPNRFFVMTLLSAVILTVYLLDYFGKKIQVRRLKVSAFAAVCLLAFFDLSMFPYPLMNFPISDFYRKVGEERGDYAIADIPIHEFAVYNYYQTAHRKPIVDGHFFYPGMVPMTYLFINLNPLLYNSMCQELPPAQMPHPGQALKQLAEANVKYVVVHNLIIHTQPECDQAGIYIRNFFAGKKPYYSDGEITVYSTE